ncbi:MAG: S1 RNA-binding domain-containing protein [Anaerolineae bacterium]|nr:S1 RNA-binding domain-containing protein [Anaerolineae bacterium]
MSDQEMILTEETTDATAVSSAASVDPEVVTEVEETGQEAAPAAAVEATAAPSTEQTTTELLTIDTLRIGQRLVGTVKNITDFGAFVDVGIPQDGLVHISKLAKWKVEKVTDVVSQGQEVEVWVKKVDKKRGRLSLTMIKPVSLRLRDIKEGDQLEGRVARLEPYGAFIDIGSEREGLVHISQISHDYIKHPEEVLAVDNQVTVQVLKVDRKKRQVDLSIKALLAPPPEKIKEPEPVVEVVEEVPAEAADEPSLTAMAIAYTALQDKQRSTKEEGKKTAVKSKQPQSEMDEIISRTLANRG